MLRMRCKRMWGLQRLFCLGKCRYFYCGLLLKRWETRAEAEAFLCLLECEAARQAKKGLCCRIVSCAPDTGEVVASEGSGRYRSTGQRRARRMSKHAHRRPTGRSIPISGVHLACCSGRVVRHTIIYVGRPSFALALALSARVEDISCDSHGGASVAKETSASVKA